MTFIFIKKTRINVKFITIFEDEFIFNNPIHPHPHEHQKFYSFYLQINKDYVIYRSSPDIQCSIYTLDGFAIQRFASRTITEDLHCWKFKSN